jgi:hypothetical protein
LSLFGLLVAQMLVADDAAARAVLSPGAAG